MEVEAHREDKVTVMVTLTTYNRNGEEKVNIFELSNRFRLIQASIQPPLKGNGEKIHVRKLSIAKRAQRFSQHPKVGASHVMYIPYNDVGNACFYYGTWLSTVQGFSCDGVHFFKSETEFSPLPTFYVTNNVMAAFKFPLHNHLPLLNTAKDQLYNDHCKVMFLKNGNVSHNR